MKIGFIGLGHMGAGMATSLLKAGHQVTVYNRTRSKADELVRKGATAAATISDACRGDAVITMLADDAAVENVVYNGGGLLASLRKGAIHISSSTISITLSARLSADHSSAGQCFIAAPVFGRPDVAEAGELFVIAAGAREAIDAANPLLEAENIRCRGDTAGCQPGQAERQFSHRLRDRILGGSHGAYRQGRRRSSRVSRDPDPLVIITVPPMKVVRS